VKIISAIAGTQKENEVRGRADANAKRELGMDILATKK
jgi:hypothetical protein